MKKSTTFTTSVRTLLTEDDVKEIMKELKYEDITTKFTSTQLLLFFMNAALGQWDSYRSGVGQAVTSGLIPVCYSTFSTKASEVPYELFKHLFNRLISKCNRETKHHLDIPKNLLLVDSTPITNLSASVCLHEKPPIWFGSGLN
ncbi:hypothetical protein J2T13_004697 [Paenibacillus sp. DS2015]|uniref:hypothetical protein n=1 Tax=Paenibacillus sp. DS2015 TaxID=3373917 RepID=UPI003D248FFF